MSLAVPSRPFLVFCVTGLLATALHTAIAVIAIEYFQLAAWLANAIAFASATLLSFLGNSLVGFKVEMARQRFLRFIVVALGGLVVAACIAKAIDVHGYHYAWGILLIVVLVPCLTYSAHRMWTFA
jgi:putative flippase GtrA